MDSDCVTITHDFSNATQASAPSTDAGSPRKLILHSKLALGDIVCMTAAVRELHRQHPGRFLTDVRTPFPEVWEYNPHVARIAEDDPQATHLQIGYTDAVNASNERGVHLMEGYCEDLAARLGLPPLRLSAFRGDLHLSDDERRWMSIPHERNQVQRYWLISTGGKKDFTVKWPIPEVMQEVVDRFRGRIQFVQVGVADDPWHHHPRLEGVIDLVGKTTTRQLIRLVHSACGVLSGITALIHLAAAVPRPDWMPKSRPCVVVAGGREPRSWFGYQTHRILETVGTLACNANGGCWKSRTVRLHDGRDDDGRLCERPVSDHPRCMWQIRPDHIVDAVESYLYGEQPL